MMGALLLALLLGQGAVLGASGDTTLVLLANPSKEAPQLSNDVRTHVESILSTRVELVSPAIYYDALSRRGMAKRVATFPRTIRSLGKDVGITHAVVMDAVHFSERVGNRGYRRRVLYLVATVVEAGTGRKLFSKKYPLIDKRLRKGTARALVRDLSSILYLPIAKASSSADDSGTSAPKKESESSPWTSSTPPPPPPSKPVVVKPAPAPPPPVKEEAVSKADESVDTTAREEDPKSDASEASDTEAESSDAEDEYADAEDEYADAEDEYSDAGDEYGDAGDEYGDSDDEYGGGGGGSSFTDSSRTFLSGEYNMQGVSDLSYAHNGEDVIEWWNFSRMKLDHKSSAARAFVEAWIRWGVVAEHVKEGDTFYVANARNGKWASDIQLREGYLAWQLGDFSFKLGQRIFVWGQNEYQPPSDILNPTDNRYGVLAGLGSTRDGKVPVFAVDASYWIGDTAFQLVVLPFFHKNRSFFYGRDFALAAPGSDQEKQLAILGNTHPSTQDKVQDSFWGTQIPEESLAGASAAFRLKSSVWGWDLALTAYYGWDRTPNIEIDPDLKDLMLSSGAMAGDLSVALLNPTIRSKMLTVQQKGLVGHELLKVSYRRMMRFAFETQGIVGPFVLRMDFGFSPKQLYYTQALESVSLPTAYGVVGFEYTYGETWYISLTGFGSPRMNPPSTSTIFGLEAALDPGTVPKVRDFINVYGAFGVVRYTWAEQNLEISLTALQNIEPDSYLASAQIKYTDWDPHDIRIGVLVLGGAKGTLFGNFDGNDFAYIQYGASW